MLMYLMDGRKVLNLLLPTLLFRRFFHFCFFSLFYTYLELKSIYCSTSFWRKKRQPIWQEARDEGYEERKGIIFVCYILDIYYSLSSIIHWIDPNLGHYSCKTVHIYKRKIVVRLEEISCLFRFTCVYFGS